MNQNDCKYITAMREFLLTFPYNAPWYELTLDHEFITTRNVDAALASTGNNLIRRHSRKNVLGEFEVWKTDMRINFEIRMRRDTADDSFRRDISNFLNCFIMWINFENANRGTTLQNPILPKFSNIDEDKEMITAQGGILTRIIDENVSEFSIQIGVDYFLKFSD